MQVIKGKDARSRLGSLSCRIRARLPVVWLIVSDISIWLLALEEPVEKKVYFACGEANNVLHLNLRSK